MKLNSIKVTVTVTDVTSVTCVLSFSVSPEGELLVLVLEVVNS